MCMFVCIIRILSGWIIVDRFSVPAFVHTCTVRVFFQHFFVVWGVCVFSDRCGVYPYPTVGDLCIAATLFPIV